MIVEEIRKNKSQYSRNRCHQQKEAISMQNLHTEKIKYIQNLKTIPWSLHRLFQTRPGIRLGVY